MVFVFRLGIVYNVDEMTGGLVISHRLKLPTRDYPGMCSPKGQLNFIAQKTNEMLDKILP